MGQQTGKGKPTLYVTNRLGQLSLTSLRDRRIEYQHVWLGWGGRGEFTCAGW